MFKWLCLGLAFLAVGVLGWMLNDVRHSIKPTVQTINENLPAILEKTRTSTTSLDQNLPEILEKTRLTTETLAELAEDIRQLKELTGATAQPRDKTLVAYATSVMNFIEESGGTIGFKKHFSSSLKDPRPAREWAASVRKQKAVFLTYIASSRKDFLTRLCESAVLGTKWYIQVGASDPVPLADWIKANHPESKDLK
jgi:hypothetical protein